MADVLRQAYPIRRRDDVRGLAVEPRRVPARVRRAGVALGRRTRTAPHTRARPTRSRPGGTIALFWNLPREFDGALGADIQAVYRDLAPMLEPLTTQWPLDETLAEIDSSDRFDIATKATVPWTQPYSRTEYVELMGTHSNHRMLDDATRAQIQAAVGAVIERHGGAVAVTYDTAVYLARTL